MHDDNSLLIIYTASNTRAVICTCTFYKLLYGVIDLKCVFAS